MQQWTLSLPASPCTPPRAPPTNAIVYADSANSFADAKRPFESSDSDSALMTPAGTPANPATPMFAATDLLLLAAISLAVAAIDSTVGLANDEASDLIPIVPAESVPNVRPPTAPCLSRDDQKSACGSEARPANSYRKPLV